MVTFWHYSLLMISLLHDCSIQQALFWLHKSMRMSYHFITDIPCNNISFCNKLLFLYVFLLELTDLSLALLHSGSIYPLLKHILKIFTLDLWILWATHCFNFKQLLPLFHPSSVYTSCNHITNNCTTCCTCFIELIIFVD